MLSQKNLTNKEIDKLVDANGDYILQPLPYNENFLEPHMDAETMHLHYTFHHGGAVKAANKDLAMHLKLPGSFPYNFLQKNILKIKSIILVD